MKIKRNRGQEYAIDNLYDLPASHPSTPRCSCHPGAGCFHFKGLHCDEHFYDKDMDTTVFTNQIDRL